MKYTIHKNGEFLRRGQCPEEDIPGLLEPGEGWVEGHYSSRAHELVEGAPQPLGDAALATREELVELRSDLDNLKHLLKNDAAIVKDVRAIVARLNQAQPALALNTDNIDARQQEIAWARNKLTGIV